jgi:hypothetical protein
MSVPKDKALDVNNMIQATEKLFAISIPEVEAVTADTALVEGIRSYLSVILTNGNDLSIGDAGLFAGVTIQQKKITDDQRTPQEIVIQGLVFFMAKDDQNRDDDGKLDSQSSGRRWKKFTDLFGLDISKLDEIRNSADIGFIAPRIGVDTVPSQNDNAQKKADQRKQATANRPKTMPKINVQAQQNQTAGNPQQGQTVNTAQQNQIPQIGTPFLASNMQFVLYKPSEAYLKPERPAIIKNYFYSNTISILYGQAGSYKTFYALWEGISLVLGKNLCGLTIEPDIKPVKVLYISLEMSAKDIADRMNKMTKNLTSAEIRLIENNFTIISAEDTANMKANNVSFLSALEQLCKSEGYNLIYIDSLADYTAGLDVRDEGDMTAVLDALRSFTLKNNVSFRIIHHGTKPSQDNNGSMAGIHTIRDLVDNVYLVKATDSMEVTVTSDAQKDRSAKSRYGKPVTLLLQFVSDDDSFSFKVIQKAETASFRENARRLLQLIEDNPGITAGELRKKNGNRKDHTETLNSLIGFSVIENKEKSQRGVDTRRYYTVDQWEQMQVKQQPDPQLIS